MGSGGLVGNFGLCDWWNSAFSEQERAQILARVDRPFSAFAGMDRGCVVSTEYNRFTFLAALSSWFTASDLHSIGRRIAIKCEAHIQECSKPVELHFGLTDLLNTWRQVCDW